MLQDAHYGTRQDQQVAFRQATLFAAIGVINTIMDILVFMSLMSWVTDSIVTANILSWLASATGSYILNSHITFRHQTMNRLSVVSYLKFMLSGVLGLCVNTGTVALAVTAMPLGAAKGVAAVAGFGVNYILAKTYVYATKKPHIH